MSAKVAMAESALTLPRGRVSDYFELTKPRVVLMVLVTTLAGFYLGGRTGFDLTLALNLLAGTALAAGGTLALNQYVERDIDAIMDRTRRRPLPDLRMRPAEALTFGVIATAGGLVYLTLATNLLCAAVTAAITIVYLGVYTPLKRYTWMCNIVGAIPGALPPVAGWAAARGGSELGAARAVRDYVPLAVAAYLRGRAPLSDRLRTRRDPPAAARQFPRRQCLESNRHRRQPRPRRRWNHPDHARFRGTPVHCHCVRVWVWMLAFGLRWSVRPAIRKRRAGCCSRQ